MTCSDHQGQYNRGLLQRNIGMLHLSTNDAMLTHIYNNEKLKDTFNQFMQISIANKKKKYASIKNL